MIQLVNFGINLVENNKTPVENSRIETDSKYILGELSLNETCFNETVTLAMALTLTLQVN